jgi:hypothetical protein
MQFQIVLEGDLGKYDDALVGTERMIIGKPKSPDPTEVYGHALEKASEWFTAAHPEGQNDWYWHASPEPTGGYFAHRRTGNTITIEEVSAA